MRFDLWKDLVRMVHVRLWEDGRRSGNAFSLQEKLGDDGRSSGNMFSENLITCGRTNEVTHTVWTD